MTIGKRWAIAIFAILFLSLGANLVVAGFSAARFAGPHGPPNFIERIVAIGIRAFPPAIQRTIEQDARERREEMRALIDAVQDSRMRMFAAMRADPFDAAALDAAFAELRSRTTELQKAGQDIVGRAVAGAPADVRIKIRMNRGPFP
jgi:uncharacterized membrane protein